MAFYTETVSEATTQWIRKLTKTIDLRIFGIDLFGDLNHPNTFTILETNSNPGLNGIWERGKQEKVFAIWKKVFEKAFE